jgi:hypothetical protein
MIDPHPAGARCLVIQDGGKKDYPIKVNDIVTVGEGFIRAGTICKYTDGKTGPVKHTIQEITDVEPGKGAFIMFPVAWMIPMPEEDPDEDVSIMDLMQEMKDLADEITNA